MIMIDAFQGRALMRFFEQHPPPNDLLRQVNDKLALHEGLIAHCEADVSRPAPQPKEPA